MTRGRALVRAIRLRCPACGGGRLYRGWFRMADACGTCRAPFLREPGFYLGSIYVNYGVTVIVTGAVYALVALVAGAGPEAGLATSLAVAVVFPVIFFHHARSLLLALDGSVNRGQSPRAVGESEPDASVRLASLAADDGRAGCALGAALVMILLFGLGMAVVTVLVVSGGERGPDESAAGAGNDPP